MTYNVFGGTLSLTQSINQSINQSTQVPKPVSEVAIMLYRTIHNHSPDSACELCHPKDAAQQTDGSALRPNQIGLG